MIGLWSYTNFRLRNSKCEVLLGSIMFHVRRRPADYHPRKRKKKPQHKWNRQQSVSNELLEYRYEDGLDRLPLFLELNPDGSEICGGAAKRHRLHPNVTEVGCERNSSPSQSLYLQLFGPNILPRHCVIANTEGIVTVTPCSRDSETYVNGQRIYETTILRNGAIVKFGRIHCFRFLDPYFEERIRQRQDSLRNIHEYTYDRQSTKEDSASSQIAMTTAEMRRNSAAAADAQTPYNFETTFDVDGNVETRSTSSQGNKEDSRSQRSFGSGSKDGNRVPSAAATYQRQGADAILPAVLEIREETEEALLNEIVSALDPNKPSFKLAPAYCLYLMARYRASTHYRPELTPTERAHRLTLMLARVANMIQKVIQERYCDITSLALWLANSSELLFFLQFDRHLIAYSKDARRMLAESVQLSFRHLIGCVQSDLSAAMPHFFADRDDTSHDHDESSTVLCVLASAMTLLRKYRVNVALTVQLFSHLFHFINVWAFNRLIAPNTNYCSRVWGLRLKTRLAQIEMWAERQGLEISTDTHLARIVQAAHLLQAPKYNAEDLASLSSTCFLLNSLQLRALLMKYQTAPDEPPLPRDLIENVVKVAEKLADEVARSNGLEVKLDEDPEFALEFVLPIDSYSCEVVRGIPPGLIQFVEPLQSMGLCRLSTQPSSNGQWTVYMELPSAKGAMMRSPSAMSNRSVGYLPGPQEPEIHAIKLHKSNNGMGLSIVAAKGAGQDKLGIYIKSVVKGGAADADGRLQAGDQLLKVDGQSLVGITQEKAAEYLVRTGPIVTLEVAKQGAIYHGLATLLSQPSPILTRESRPRPRSELFAEPFRDVLPSSFSMINLNQNSAYVDHGVQWLDQRTAGVTTAGASNTAGYKVVVDGGGGSSGTSLRTPPRKKSFQSRYGNFLHPDYALLYPKNVCHEEEAYDEDEEVVAGDDRDNGHLRPPAPARGVLTTDSFNRMNAGPAASYTPPPVLSPDSKLCLCKDVLAQRRTPEQEEEELPGQTQDDAKNSSSIITRRLVSDVTSCCLGVLPECDGSVGEEPKLLVAAAVAPVRVGTEEKSVMTDESLFQPLPRIPAFRNSCPLISPKNDLCECEKPIFRSQSQTGKIVYRNGVNSSSITAKPEVTIFPDQPAASTMDTESSGFLKEVVALNAHYHRNNLQQVIIDHSRRKMVSGGDDTIASKSLQDLKSTAVRGATRGHCLSRRSSSDASLYQKNSVMAECTRCGNRFDVRATYFSGPVYEHVTSTSSEDSTSVSSSSESTTSTDREANARDRDRKLTKEERENILKELEDIVSGEFFTKAAATTDTHQPEGSAFASSSMLHLDLNSLRSSGSSSPGGSLTSRQASPSPSPSSYNVDSRYKIGRVAELARHFSMLGQAGMIQPATRPKTKSVPDIRAVLAVTPPAYRSASVEELPRMKRECSVHREQNIQPGVEDDDERTLQNECVKRRQSYARQNTVFCQVKSVDELDSKRRQAKCKLYKYASLADFRAVAETSDLRVDAAADKKKIVSADNLKAMQQQDVEQRAGEEKVAVEDAQSYDEEMKLNYNKMTTAIRDYLANKELLLKRMKSNSVDNNNYVPVAGMRRHLLSKLNRACPNFTSVREADEQDMGDQRRDAMLKAGMSLDALYYENASLDADEDFTFKDSIRRVYKGPFFKNRRFRNCRKLGNRRSVLIFSGETLNRCRLGGELKVRQQQQGRRCQSLDTGVEAGGGGGIKPSRGRRMSERDLPSRVANEQPNQATQLPMHAPVIHSSKSVPSLNSSGTNEGQVVTPVASRSSNEVFNPGYNSTSSPNNVHQQQQAAALRSKSSQNLNDSRSLNNYPQPNMSHTLPNRQTPNSSMLANANSSSPMYPPQYGQPPAQQHPMYHQHVQQQQMLLHQQQQQHQHYQYSLQNSSISETGERFYQNLNVYRNSDMPNGVIHEVVGSGPAMKGKMMSPQQERASNQFQRSFRGSQTSLQQQQQLPQGRQSAEMYMRDRPASAYMQKENYPPQPMGMSGRSQSTRDMLRQEAKLQEMTEEVRRREMRSNFSPQQQHYPISPNCIQSPTENNSDPNGLHYQSRPGPLSPIMYGNDGQPVRMVYANHKGPLLRPSIEEIGYRESPPPPPPPPTSTHPLYQSSSVQRSPDNRYQASVGEPPKGGYYSSSPVTSSSKHYQLQGTNPWEREEREKEVERRREACKEWRDQQINELVSLGQSRNQSQEEQLRSLRLEKEFERRALEEEEDEDEDQETAERIQDVMRTAREQDDLRNSSNKSNSYTPPGRYPPQLNGSISGGARLQGSGAQNIMEEKERLRRLKEMKMKQAEQESMKMDETRFRQKENYHNTSGLNGHHTPESAKTLSRPTHLKLDNHSGRNHVANSSYSNLQDYSTLTAAAAAPQQRLDNLLDAPPPPERGSSFAVMSHAYRSPVTTPSSHTITPKKVSFQETTSETPTEKVMEDPNRFISEAENLLSSPKSPDTQFMNSTPGVIGNQEVYKDPRQRRLQEQQHQKLLSNKTGPVPEKLTFKEKMKMFAMETGEEGTPKDKVKISRAQRDIDNLNSPSATNDGVNNKNPSTVNENVDKVK